MKKNLFFAYIFMMFFAMAGCGKFAGIAGKKEPVVVITTDLGEVHLILYDQTPKHKKNFLKLVNNGYYNGTTFHRIIDDFMVQGGDPNTKDKDPANDGQGGPEYTIAAEIKPELKHKQGAVAAARKGDNVNPQMESNGSQFYIVEPKDGTPFLDGKYTVFGQVVKGINIIEKIAAQKKDRKDRPLKDIKMKMSVVQMSKKKIEETYKFKMP